MNEYIALPKRAVNISGQRFGRLVALGPVGISVRKSLIWRCRCDCGNLADVSRHCLQKGSTQSCGCLRQERTLETQTKHGMYGTSIYKAWVGIIQRCENPNDKSYGNYGGRGITVCNEWHDFQTFYDYAIQLPNYGENGFSIDRINNNEGYLPDNVRWASRKTQQRNRRGNVILTHNGKTQCLSAWAEETKISAERISQRIRLGWTIDDALTQPIRSLRKNNQ